MAFEWYFRLPKAAQRRTDICIRMLIHSAKMSAESALQFLYSCQRSN